MLIMVAEMEFYHGHYGVWGIEGGFYHADQGLGVGIVFIPLELSSSFSVSSSSLSVLLISANSSSIVVEK